MEYRETARMRKYGESKTTRIMMATVPHVTSGLGLRKFQPDGFLLTRVYKLATNTADKKMHSFSRRNSYVRRRGYTAGASVDLSLTDYCQVELPTASFRQISRER